jgi:hypothetical protein
MQRGNDLLIAGVGYVANGTVRRLIWNKPYLNILRGAVIRDGRAFTPNKKDKQKAKAPCPLCSLERSAGSRQFRLRVWFENLTMR